MERRHQVFVSSTFSDLKAERSEIIQALLELDCFPAGMELFPATSASAWDLIRGVIDDSDYYCLVIGGRYGSLDSVGVGFTEKEYDYAIATNKPLMVFLHKDPGSIPLHQSESTDSGKEKLKKFREKVEKTHHCKYWSSAEELGGQVSRSLIVLRKTIPADGWVPGKFAADESLILESATLKARVSQLEAELVVSASREKNAIATDLARGQDKYTAEFAYLPQNEKDYTNISTEVTWDKILGYVGPTLLGECNEEEFLEKLRLCFYHSIPDEAVKKARFDSIIIPHVISDEIKVQLRALGQMAPGIKRRAVSNQKNYWKLTEEGEARLIQVQAVKRDAKAISSVTELAVSDAVGAQSTA